MAPKHRKPHISWGADAPEREPPKMCATAGKRMYASEAEAKSTARHQMSQKDFQGGQLRTYRCLYCGAWHLTSKEA
jgi:hypothetical protein